MYIYAATALIALAVGFGGGWRIQAWRHDSAELVAQQNAQAKARMQRQGADAGAQAFEVVREKLRTEVQYIRERIDVEVEKPVYRNVCLPADGLRDLNDAIRAANNPGEPSHPMPAASGTP